MIISFKCKETEKIFGRVISKKFPFEIQKIALRKLWMLDAVTEINALRIPPSNRLEALKGKRKGVWSIRINDQWRICFKWENNNATEVQITDYH
ncbi:MAG: hypothetical protein ACD_79C00947G0001 [uncultured bacterium]|nr:MAG: hypothetical protein ACD_79C00947G0001 [uncultured bacterium]